MKFPESTMLATVSERPRYNLAESTVMDLQFGALMDVEFVEQLNELTLGYGSTKGSRNLRQLIARKLRMDVDDVLVTSGAIGGIVLVMQALCSHGDDVVTCLPNFSSTLDLIKGLGFGRQLLKLNFDEQYQLDVDKLLALVTPRTKLIILVSPLNPSGTLLEPSRLEELLFRLDAMNSDCTVLVDETYREATCSGDVPASFSTLSPRVVTVSSLSKSYGVPGLRIGWLSTPNRALLHQINLVKVNTLISNSVLDEWVAMNILQREKEILQSTRCHLQQGFELTKCWVKRNEELVDWIEPRAGAFCCVRLKKDRFTLQSLNRFHAMLGAAKIQVANGEWFGESNHIFRIGFSNLETKDLQVALIRLEEVLQVLTSYVGNRA